jgi:hypothetical protein
MAYDFQRRTGFASSDTSHSAPTASPFGDQDAAELFRAVFGEDLGYRKRQQGAGGSSVTTHEGPMLVRLLTAFRRNPWTLVTALSVLSSFVSIFESLCAIFGEQRLQAAGLILVTGGVFMSFCPPSRRREVAMAGFALLLVCGAVF